MLIEKNVLMNNFKVEFVEVDVADFTVEQKLKLMQFAVADKEYIERCNIIQSEFDSIDEK